MEESRVLTQMPSKYDAEVCLHLGSLNKVKRRSLLVTRQSGDVCECAVFSGLGCKAGCGLCFLGGSSDIPINTHVPYSGVASSTLLPLRVLSGPGENWLYRGLL